MPEVIESKSLHAFAERIEPMTDEEFAEYFHELVEREQDSIDKQIAHGAVFVRSNLGGIHTLQCRNSGFYASRREAYEALTPNMASMRLQLAHGSPPTFPDLLTLNDVVALTNKYRRCKVCAPDVPEYVSAAKTPLTHEGMVEKLQYSVERYKAKPQAALLAILDMHSPSGTIDVCVSDGDPWPCETVEAIRSAFGVK